MHRGYRRTSSSPCGQSMSNCCRTLRTLVEAAEAAQAESEAAAAAEMVVATARQDHRRCSRRMALRLKRATRSRPCGPFQPCTSAWGRIRRRFCLLDRRLPCPFGPSGCRSTLVSRQASSCTGLQHICCVHVLHAIIQCHRQSRRSRTAIRLGCHSRAHIDDRALSILVTLRQACTHHAWHACALCAARARAIHSAPGRKPVAVMFISPFWHICLNGFS